MCHWQWFLLVITISFVVSNGGERINKRSIHIHPNSKKRRETSKPEVMSTHVKFPLWVSIGGLGSIGATTEYKKLNDNLYEFTLPFLVLVKESDVCTNRSAKQDKNLAYPFWVQISDVQREYASHNIEGKARLAFPFDLEVAKMSIVGKTFGIRPVSRVLSENDPVGTVGLKLASLSLIVVSTVVGAIVLTHVVKAAVHALWEAAVRLFRPQENTNPQTFVGYVAGGLAGVIVSFVPGLSDIVKSGIKRFAEVSGDTLITFVKILMSQQVFGDVTQGIHVAMYMLQSIPFTSWRNIQSNQNHTAVRLPPSVFSPTIRKAPTSDLKMICLLKLSYGQETIPGYPDYIVVWPGRQEPPPTDSVIVRPIVPTLPLRPNINLLWPIQSSYDVRPNIVLIMPGQRFIPGYVNVVIVWPRNHVPDDEDIILLRPPQEKIESILGVVFIWPGLPPSHGPYVIRLQPQQRQHSRFPTIIFVYPGDLLPPRLPGITTVYPPLPGDGTESVIPGYDGITIIWPEVPETPTQPTPTTEMTHYTSPLYTSPSPTSTSPTSPSSTSTSPTSPIPTTPSSTRPSPTSTSPTSSSPTSPSSTSTSPTSSSPTSPSSTRPSPTSTSPTSPSSTSNKPYTSTSALGSEGNTYIARGQGFNISPHDTPKENMEIKTYTTPVWAGYTYPTAAPNITNNAEIYSTHKPEVYTYPTAQTHKGDQVYKTSRPGASTSPSLVQEDNKGYRPITTPEQGVNTFPLTTPQDITEDQTNNTTKLRRIDTSPTTTPTHNTGDKTYTTPGSEEYTYATYVTPSPGYINNPSTKGYPSISSIPETIMVGPDEIQVPGYPNIMIIDPGRPKPQPMIGIIFIQFGQLTIPEYPHLTLCWPAQKARITRITITTVEIPPAFTKVPGYPQFSIDRSGQTGQRPFTVKPGDATLPGNSNVMLIWLERPTDLALGPPLEVAGSSFIYDVSYEDSRDKRSVGDEASGGFLRISDDKFADKEFGQWNTRSEGEEALNIVFDHNGSPLTRHLSKSSRGL